MNSHTAVKLIALASVLILPLIVVLIADSEETNATNPDDWRWVRVNDSPVQVTIMNYTGPGGSVIIPSEIMKWGWYRCEVISVSSLTNTGKNIRADITELIFEEGIKTIWGPTYYELPNLNKITIPKSATFHHDRIMFYDEHSRPIKDDEIPGYTYERKNVGGAVNCMVRVLVDHTISFDVCGGSNPMEPIQVTEKSRFTLPDYQGIKQNQTFKGWSYDEKTYSPGQLFTMPNEDVTFSAIWGNSFPGTAYIALLLILAAVISLLYLGIKRL